MIKFHEIKVGDLVLTNLEGRLHEGEVTGLNLEDKEVCVRTEVQEFWFTANQLQAIPLTDSQLIRFKFEKQENADGSVKYLRGPFRMLLPRQDSFSHFDMWYREDRRHINHHVAVHELQNHYRQMTKVELTRDRNPPI